MERTAPRISVFFREHAVEIFWLLLVIGAGTLARFWDLAWQFSHNDDIGVAKTLLDARMAGKFWDLLAVPRLWTYAPGQFLFTHFLVWPWQSYREILFWGRLPSCLAGIAGLVLFVQLYRRLTPDWFPRVLPGLALMACSWQNIIYARHMSNYALGVTAAAGLMIFYLRLSRFCTQRLGTAVAAGLGLCLFSLLHYQILYFAPAFLGALALGNLKRSGPARALMLAAAGAVVYAALFGPFFFHYVWRLPRYFGWSGGPQHEFLFAVPAGLDFFHASAWAAGFFFRNGLLVLQSSLAFLPPQHPLFVPAIYYGVSFFALFGVLQLMTSREPGWQDLSRFLGLLALTWAALIVKGAMAWSPTRHQMILIPVFALLAGEGIYGFAKTAGGMLPEAFRALFQKLPAAAALAVLVLFAAGYPVFLQERRDPVHEDEIVQTLREYQAGAVLAINNPSQMLSMRTLTEEFGYYETGLMEYDVLQKTPADYRTVAWVSLQKPLTQTQFLVEREPLQAHQVMRNALLRSRGLEPVPVFQGNWDDYRILYRREISSGVEMDYSSRTHNGTNSFYFYVLRLKEAA